MQDHFDVAIVGAGAAGLAAAVRLSASPLEVVVLEARPRIGGRAVTLQARPDLPLDLGAGWLHSADRNPLVEPLEQRGFTIDRSRPAWEKQSGNPDFPPEDQRAFGEAYDAFEDRLAKAAETGADRPASDFLEPGGRWNALIDAISSYYNGAEYDQVSVLDYAAYQDSEVNWRVAEGYGAGLAALGSRVPVVLECPVTRIDHSARPIRLTTARGAASARAVIIAVPTPHLAQGRLSFQPELQGKTSAAAGLPLGLADKVFLYLDTPEDLPVNGHLTGATSRTGTGSYHLRPFGRPYIEGFFGGRHALALEAEGRGAATAFAVEELVRLLGSDIRRRLTPIHETGWAGDPWALGSYSHALPGQAGARAILAAPVGARLFFAGEATHASQYSTVHGAWESGVLAATEVSAALGVALT